ncbi:PREDICTED: uncharacterized protein LOC106810774 [Priapulus caudatus]|uniref:Uncharacterized protein LOC106810774 n=1 Tax=Priapulus caudatus TaxID=37621 RepID=A0ABM1EBY8_PRICU|nr:PREDICTED: uncharacterized protein LOC106810774 [Priapulus caudatus]
MASYRKATLADRQQVVDMQVYEGLDYIQNVYNQHLTEWNSSAYVGEKDGQIVSFNFIILVDDGDTIISRGARTREEYKHQGIINGLYKYSFKDFTERYPNVCWYGDVRHVDGHVTTKPETRIVCNAPCCTMKPICPDAVLRHYGESGRLPDYGRLQQLTKGQIHRLFTTQEVATKLFGEYNDHVVISWMPYRTIV